MRKSSNRFASARRSLVVIAAAAALFGGVEAVPAWLTPAVATASTPADRSLAEQAIWDNYNGNVVNQTAAMAQLTAHDPALAQRTEQVLSSVGTALLTVPNPAPVPAGPQTAIVVLGYGLLPNGTMRPELVNRLSAGLREAQASPSSPIVVTGGNPQSGVAEGQAMKAWLTGHGIPADRVHAETRANSTVQNALFSTTIIKSIGATNAVLVSSPDHIRRATADFLVAGTPVVGVTTSTTELAAQLPPPDKSERWGIYQDAIKVFQAQGN